MLPANRQDTLVLSRGNNSTRRIAGRIQNQKLCPGSEGSFDRRSLHAEALFRLRLHKDRRSTRILHDVRKAHPVGRGDDDRVSLLNQYAHHVKDGMFAANADHAFFWFEGGAEFALVPCANRFAQRHDTARRRVF